MKSRAGMWVIGMLLLTGCTQPGSTDHAVSELKMRGGRGPVHTVVSKVYEFPEATAPEDMADWMPGENDVPVIESTHEFDRSGWILNEETIRREEDPPYRSRRDCEASRKHWRECRLTDLPSGFLFGETTTHIDAPDGFHYAVRMNDDVASTGTYRIWGNRDTGTVYSESTEVVAGQSTVINQERWHYDPDGYLVLKVTRKPGEPEVRAVYDHVAMDTQGNVTRHVERQDPQYPNPERPGTVRLHVVEFGYYESDHAGGNS